MLEVPQLAEFSTNRQRYKTRTVDAELKEVVVFKPSAAMFSDHLHSIFPFPELELFLYLADHQYENAAILSYLSNNVLPKNPEGLNVFQAPKEFGPGGFWEYERLLNL